jgi:hypothetical protein
MRIIVAAFAGAGGCLGTGDAEPEPGELASTGPAAVLRAPLITCGGSENRALTDF